MNALLRAALIRLPAPSPAEREKGFNLMPRHTNPSLLPLAGEGAGRRMRASLNQRLHPSNNHLMP